MNSAWDPLENHHSHRKLEMRFKKKKNADANIGKAVSKRVFILVNYLQSIAIRFVK